MPSFIEEFGNYLKAGFGGLTVKTVEAFDLVELLESKQEEYKYVLLLFAPGVPLTVVTGRSVVDEKLGQVQQVVSGQAVWQDLVLRKIRQVEPSTGVGPDLVKHTNQLQRLNAYLLDQYGEQSNQEIMADGGIHFVVLFQNVLSPELAKNQAMIQYLQSGAYAGKSSGVTYVIHSFDGQVGPQLEPYYPVLDFKLPEQSECINIIQPVLSDGAELWDEQPVAEAELLEIARATKGLTRRQIEDTTALLVRKRQHRDPTAYKQLKISVAEQNGLFKVVPVDKNKDKLFGLDGLVDFASPLLKHGSTTNKDIRPKGLLFVGPPGCLCGNTELLYRRGKRNSGRRITLKRLFQKFNSLPVTGGRGKVTPWHKDVDTFLHSIDLETGKVFYNRILGVVYSGQKQCLSLKLSTGEVLLLTADHKVLTPNGFVAAGQLSSGDEVVCRGAMTATSKVNNGRNKKKRIIVYGLKYYAAGMQQNVKDAKTGNTYVYKRQSRARLVVEADMNGMSYSEYVNALKTDPTAVNLKTLSEKIEVHHKNENALDDRLENLELLSKAEHTLRHDPQMRLNVEYVNIAHVVSIEAAEERETYDIQMQSPANNFATASGLIVHNSGKTAASSLLAETSNRTLCQVDLGSLRSKWVGETESRVDRMFEMVESLAPAMLLVDEVEKSLDGAQSSGETDGGLGSRVLGKFLTWAQDHEEDVLLVATANDITRITDNFPEMLRAERFDAMFMFDLPNPDARRQMWRYYMGKFGLDKPTSSLLDELVSESDNWTGAEIRACCRLAAIREVSVKQQLSLVPNVYKVATDVVEGVRSHAAGRFIDADSGLVYSNKSQAQEKKIVRKRRVTHS